MDSRDDQDTYDNGVDLLAVGIAAGESLGALGVLRTPSPPHFNFASDAATLVARLYTIN